MRAGTLHLENPFGAHLIGGCLVVALHTFVVHYQRESTNLNLSLVLLPNSALVSTFEVDYVLLYVGGGFNAVLTALLLFILWWAMVGAAYLQYSVRPLDSFVTDCWVLFC